MKRLFCLALICLALLASPVVAQECDDPPKEDIRLGVFDVRLEARPIDGGVMVATHIVVDDGVCPSPHLSITDAFGVSKSYQMVSSGSVAGNGLDLFTFTLAVRPLPAGEYLITAEVPGGFSSYSFVQPGGGGGYDRFINTIGQVSTRQPPGLSYAVNSGKWVMMN